MSDLKSAYLVSGDDEVKLDSWRRRLRSRAEAEGPSTTLEVVKDEKLTGDAVAAVLSSMTLSIGRRYVLVEGIERWKERDAEPVAAALAGLPAETVVVFIASPREERGKLKAVSPPARLVKSVKAAGGEVHECPAPKSREYPRWVAERAGELGVAVSRDGAQALIERIGQNPRRLVRELEKLSIFVGPGDGREVGRDTVEKIAGSAVEARTYQLADAVIAGDGERALRLAEDLRAQDEDLMYILFSLLRALRDWHRAWILITCGATQSQVRSDLRVPDFVARRLVDQARRADGERIERAIDLVADLDFEIRGGGTLDAESALTLTLARASAG